MVATSCSSWPRWRFRASCSPRSCAGSTGWSALVNSLDRSAGTCCRGPRRSLGSLAPPFHAAMTCYGAQGEHDSPCGTGVWRIPDAMATEEIQPRYLASRRGNLGRPSELCPRCYRPYNHNRSILMVQVIIAPCHPGCNILSALHVQ